MKPGTPTRWAVARQTAPLRVALEVVPLVLRLYVAGVTGFVLGVLGLQNLGILGHIGFLPYGFDKLLGGNVRFGMGGDFFQELGFPLPAVTSGFVGALELFGSLALIAGLFTRPAAIGLASTMLVAILNVGNLTEELPLYVACLLLIWTGGGRYSLDYLRTRNAPAATELTPVPAAAGPLPEAGPTREAGGPTLR